MIPLQASKLSPGHKRGLIALMLVLALTGIVWMAGYYTVFVWPELDGPDARSWLHLLVMGHGVLGYLAAVMAGSLLARHVPAGLKSRRKLISGLTGLSLTAGLILTALLLYYAGSPELREAASLVHQVLGVAAVGAVAFHVTAQLSGKAKGRAKAR